MKAMRNIMSSTYDTRSACSAFNGSNGLISLTKVGSKPVIFSAYSMDLYSKIMVDNNIIEMNIVIIANVSLKNTVIT